MAIFAPIFTEINHIVQNTIAGNVSVFVHTLSPIFFSAFVIYLLFVFLSYWQGLGAEGVMIDMLKRVVSWALVLGFSINVGAYNDVVLPIVLHFGDELSSLFTGMGSPESGLDALIDYLIVTVNSNQADFNLLQGIDSIGSKIAGIFINMLLILCFSVFLVVAGAYIVLTKVFLALLAIIGPVFILCGLFPATRQYCMSWVNQVLNYSFLVLFINVVAVVFATYLSNATAGVNLAAYQGVVQIMMTSGIFTIVLFKLPDLASGLIAGIAAGGFGNAFSAVSQANRALQGRFGMRIPSKRNSGGSIKPK